MSAVNPECLIVALDLQLPNGSKLLDEWITSQDDAATIRAMGKRFVCGFAPPNDPEHTTILAVDSLPDLCGLLIHCSQMAKPYARTMPSGMHAALIRYKLAFDADTRPRINATIDELQQEMLADMVPRGEA
jgi:hypothetical protein